MYKANINPAHRWLLNYFDPPYAWFDCINFTWNAPLCLENVKKTLQLMVKRHDGLRTSFVKEEDKWQQIVHEDIPGSLLEPVFVDDDLKLMHCQEFDVSQLPLFKLLILKKSDTHYDLSFIFHHIIVDYVSLVLFFKEFYQFYKSNPNNTLAPATNYDYAKAIEKLEKSLAKERAYASPFNIHPGVEGNSLYETMVVPKDLAYKLQRYGKAHFNSDSFQPILTAPLYKAIRTLINSTEIIVSHKLHGREPVPGTSCFFSAIGNFAVNVPIACSIKGDSWQELINVIAAELKRDNTKGLFYDLENNDPDHHLAPIRFNFLGNISFGVPDDLKLDFHRFAHRITPPDQKLTTYIEFFVYFCENELFIQICVDGLNINKQWSDQLMKLYVDNVINLINTIEVK